MRKLGQRPEARRSVRALERPAPSIEGGQPLETRVKSLMESRFHHDFGQVRIHTGDRATRSAEAIGAQAYTVGSDIAFAADAFDPGTDEGERLLAHELTHVVQHETVLGAEVPRQLELSDPAGSEERAAEHVEHDYARGAPLDVPSAGPEAAATVHRVVDPFGLTLLTDAALGEAGLDVAAMGTADSAAAQAFVNAWGGPAALAETASGAGALGAETAAVTTAAAPVAAAEMGSASTLIGSGALEAAGLDVGAMAAADTAAAEGMIAAWGGPAAFAEAAGIGAGGAEAAALGGGALAAEGAAAGAGGAAAGLGAGAILPLAAAAAAGVAGGIGLDKLSNWVGQEVTGDTKGDYSISGAIGSGLTAADESLTSLWADPTQPAYTQTLGWKLANWLD